jgi:two-component system, OmpR family, sensor histidine kinase BaeS
MRLRLLFAFTIVVLASVISMALILQFEVAREVRSFIRHGGMINVDRLITALVQHHRTTETWDGVDRVFAQYQRGMGRMFGQSGNPAGGSVMMRVRLADAQELFVYDTASLSMGQSMTLLERQQSIEIKDGNRLIGYLLFGSGTTLSNLDESLLLERLNQAGILAASIGGVLALILSLGLAYGLLRPIKALTAASKALADGDLSQRVRVDGGDEMAVLGNTFNQMADSLQKAETSRRALTADIAHELRTPLAVQRAHLEALEDGIYPLSPDNLKPILEQNVLLNRLVDDLRTLALADAGKLTLDQVPTDLPELVRRIVQRYEPQTAPHKIDLRFEASGHCQSLALDPGRIEQILGNLLTNALRHTPDKGFIQVSVICQERNAVISVRDTGPGIQPADLPHVFERFYRADRSRSRAEGGTGLGLTIAQKLALAHGGRLEASNHPEGGAIFTLRLPGRTT